MFQPALNLIREECSGSAALNLVADISRYHRIQVSPGYREAANYVLEKLKAWGLPAELLRFKADIMTVILYGHPAGRILTGKGIRRAHTEKKFFSYYSGSQNSGCNEL